MSGRNRSKSVNKHLMKLSQIIYLIIIFFFLSCKEKPERNEAKKPRIGAENIVEIDTSKLYQRINIPYYENDKLVQEYEVYVSKKNDTFWNTWKFYKDNKLDKSKSKYFDFNITGNKNDSILKGIVSIYSPADSIPESQISSREITFVYLQKEKDSLIFKEIITDKSTIEFDYKNFENYSFEGHITDLRFIKIDSTTDKLLLNRNYFTIDTKVSTNNAFVDLLK